MHEPSPPSLAQFIDAVHDSHVLPREQLQGLAYLCRTPRDLGRALIERGWLTPFQVNEIHRGRGQALTVGAYLLLEKVGQGARGTVFKARHRRMKRLAAVKVLHPGVLDRFRGIERFLREAQTAARLDHPNVVHAFDADVTGETAYLAMEYVDGVDLGRLVSRDGPLPVRLACDYARQAALGLQHAHERGVVHRDLKPSNLLLGGATVKLVDFGLSLLAGAGKAGDLTVAGRFVGTPDYLSPEQALRPQSADHRSDLFTLGSTLHFLLSGQPPFPGGSIADKIGRQLHEAVAPVEGMPPALAVLMRKLMARCPENRFQTAAEVAKALAGLGLA
jgi:serine/threonine-protein kinase